MELYKCCVISYALTSLFFCILFFVCYFFSYLRLYLAYCLSRLLFFTLGEVNKILKIKEKKNMDENTNETSDRLYVSMFHFALFLLIIFRFFCSSLSRLYPLKKNAASASSYRLSFTSSFILVSFLQFHHLILDFFIHRFLTHWYIVLSSSFFFCFCCIFFLSQFVSPDTPVFVDQTVATYASNICNFLSYSLSLSLSSSFSFALIMHDEIPMYVYQVR